VTTIHNFSENISEIVPRNDLVLGKIIEEDVSTDSKITVVEIIDSGPTLGAELLST